MKIYIAQVRENTFDNPVDSYTHIKTFRFEDDATVWALGKVEDIKKDYPDAVEVDWCADDVDVKHVSYRIEEQTPVGYEDSYPCVMTSREDFESQGYDTSGLDDKEFERLVSKMGDTIVENQYWVSVECAAEYAEMPKTVYNGERYADVTYYYKDRECSDYPSYDGVIVIGEPVVEGSYEDNNSFFHVNSHDELLALMQEDNGEDFVVESINGYSNEI